MKEELIFLDLSNESPIDIPKACEELQDKYSRRMREILSSEIESLYKDVCWNELFSISLCKMVCWTCESNVVLSKMILISQLIDWIIRYQGELELKREERVSFIWTGRNIEYVKSFLISKGIFLPENKCSVESS